MANRGPFISIVTPVYNGEKYLSECIRSVLDQTYKNYEYIIVNNCSTDKTWEIIEKFARQHSCIKIHHNQNLVGVIENHNIAFNLISDKSKYCKVVQADDWLYPECLEKMIAVGEREKNVSLIGSYVLYGEQVVSDRIPIDQEIFSGRDICKWTLLGTIYPFVSPTSILFKTDYIRKKEKFYNEPFLNADVEACYDLLKETNFGFVHQVLSFVRKHQESQTSINNEKYSWLFISGLDLLKKFGPIYLDDKEFSELWHKKIQEYYKFMGISSIRLRGKDFWSYQKAGMRELGIKFKAHEVAKYASIEILSNIGRPSAIIRKILNKTV